jgi:AbrB family looped-hinge helix DNA binding protein
MRTTIDADGRVVVPSAIRRRAVLRPGMLLDVRWQDGRIEVEPVALPVNVVPKGHLVVAVPQSPLEPLAARTVEETRRALRRERKPRL